MSGNFFTVAENRMRNASPGASRKASFAKLHLEVRMFNVGEGEAILLIFPQKRAWLIDGGSSSGNKKNSTLGVALAAYLKERKLRLDGLVPSHPHKDHVGAVAGLLRAKPRMANPLSVYRSDDSTWNKQTGWLPVLRAELQKLKASGRLNEVALKDAHRDIALAPGVEAHFFAGSGEGPYTSIFLHLRYHEARLLFTGDSHCSYEVDVLNSLGPSHFRADVLKVTHHGSSSGTAQKVVNEVRPGIAIASTDADDGHRLEKDTLARLGGHKNPRRVFETHVDGDIILRTDGKALKGGILYQVEFDTPGRFENDLDAEVSPLSQVSSERETGNHPACK